MGNSRPGGAPPTSSGNVARSNAEAATETPHLRPHEGPGVSGSGSPGRSTPLPGGRERGSTGENVMTPSYDRQQNRPVEEARHRASSAVKKSSVPNSLSRGSDINSGSRMDAEEQVMSEQASNGDAGSSSKKRRKRMDARSYIKRFKTGIRVGASGITSSLMLGSCSTYLKAEWSRPLRQIVLMGSAGLPILLSNHIVIIPKKKSHCNHGVA